MSESDTIILKGECFILENCEETPVVNRDKLTLRDLMHYFFDNGLRRAHLSIRMENSPPGYSPVDRSLRFRKMPIRQRSRYYESRGEEDLILDFWIQGRLLIPFFPILVFGGLRPYHFSAQYSQNSNQQYT
ncbi:MAG: hypothetical protein H8D45_02605 [Bacteroidetes bacterium]|nr:hypothetical protein [Bacteroidota bacterium]